MNNIEKEFVPYQESLELKELGFDQYSCLGNFADDKNHTLFTNGSRPGKTNAPTFSQAFRWFREKFKLHSYIEGAYPWFRYYVNSDDNRWEGFKHSIHEEAELACLRKLIQIVKEKQ